jgi:hypothetical protein
MKKKMNSVTISISYNQAVTPDSIDNTIAQEIHQIESATTAIQSMRETLCAFIKENREAINVEEVTATLKANGYAKQRISDLLLSYGITRRAPSKSQAAKGEKVEAKFNEAKTALMKLCGNDKKLFRAVITRLYQKAK